ncbi:hypothetical protein PLICRDRAFT_178724 [Plicaturopsis crispa FD-325 SS-3]|nr:hypothetical protein PLICRDRAFT_178724 [Plicaturopsis crispa FD-325 SS-3]
MASSSSSGSPSSSAVTIPIPGKSILKRPPPAQQSLFSRFIRILPTQPPPSSDESKPLKRAHFILPQIATVYPISSLNPPSTPNLRDEKKAIDDREAERRRRVVRGNSISVNETEEWWTLDKVESFYRECCAGCDERPDPAITAAFKHAAGTNPRTVDLSGVQLTDASASILSDVFTIEWGLRKLVFRECDLDDHKLKPMLHALLIPGTLSFLSVSSNRRLKTPAFRLIGAYVAKAKSLQFLDLSQNPLDKKSIEYVVAALVPAPEPGLVSLRLDDCSLRPAALEALAHAVRTSSLRNISLRHNKITSTGAVALALMIKDYPDVVPGSTPPTSVPSSPSPNPSSLPPTSSSAVSPASSISPQLSVPSSPRTSIFSPARAGPPLPPPRHPASAAPQTTYTPYIPRARRGAGSAGPTSPNPLSSTGQPIPIITSSSQGGVTTRHPTAPASDGHAHNGNAHAGPKHDYGPSAALLDKVRALDALPRLGALRTLDLRGNDLRSGISYIAQVLKRNRTLKVLNLSENKLDVQCLVAIAEALKYNSNLETLDLSKNPCSGPGLEGIQSLRTAFTLNTALRRLFLSSTSMTSAGAIALAEFLPESTSLLHLDLTLNNLDIAGVMALSSGLKANHTMRCLDLNIPPGDEEFARMCRDILSSCVRNTEEAERNAQQAPNGAASGRGLGKGVWGMIEESELAKTIRLGEEKQVESDLVAQARACIAQLEATEPKAEPPADVLERAKSLTAQLASAIQTTSDAGKLEELLDANDVLTALLVRAPSGTGTRGLKLHGLGLKLDDAAAGSNNNAAAGVNGGNGQAVNAYNAGDSDDEEFPPTPRVDKGKGRAPPEPEEPEKVLTPNFLIESEDEDEENRRFRAELRAEEELSRGGVASPTDRSRSWVEEEGEVFRKGTVLLGPDEMEGEYAGEDLRKELLEAMVERPPPRPVFDEELPINGEHLEQQHPTSPAEQKKPPPRPYMPRSRSSSSILTVTSPTTAQGSTSQSPLTASPSSSSRPYLSGSRSPSANSLESMSRQPSASSSSAGTKST